MSIFNKMNKKGDFGSSLKSNIIFLILLVLFLGAMIVFVSKKDNGDEVWAQYYASEIASIINMAEYGDEIILDVQKATEIAERNGVAFSNIFNFDNANNEVIVRVSSAGASGAVYYNDADIAAESIELGIYDGINKLKFKVVENR